MFMGRRRAIFKYVPQVSIASGAQDFGAIHPHAFIGFFFYIEAGDRFPETRPSCSGFELFIDPEEVRSAADAFIYATDFPDLALSGERRLRAFLARNAILFGGENLLPFGVGFYYAVNFFDFSGAGVKDGYLIF